MKAIELTCPAVQASVPIAPPASFIIFGASGDLAARKLIPALHGLYAAGLAPDRFRIIGCGRSPISDADFRGLITLSIAAAGQKLQPDFPELCHYTTLNYGKDEDYARLAELLDKLESPEQSGGKPRPEAKTPGMPPPEELTAPEYAVRVYYLAIPPSQCGPVVERLNCCRLAGRQNQGSHQSRVIIEKPFGHDYESAIALNRTLSRLMNEGDIFRMDHYLGKETVQNILMLRFANAVFEPLWNRHYIDRVQITVAESIGVEHRAGYFDGAGIVRDMFQNHILQMLALVTMEPPSLFTAENIRDEKAKLLSATRLATPEKPELSVVTGQYGPGRDDGQATLPGYLQEKGIPENSRTETYAAIKLFVDNWRWQGVPFYLRAGKRLNRRKSEIALHFRQVPHSIFTPVFPCPLPANALILKVQPEQGIALQIQAKKPGLGISMSSLEMAFNYEDVFHCRSPEAYQRLLLDCINGDQTLFVREDSMLQSWQIIAPVLESIDRGTIKPFPYPAGSGGPLAAAELFDGWREI